MDRQVKPSDIVLMASGAVALIFSFLDWYSAPGYSINGWSMDLTFPIGTYIPIIGLLLGGHVALTRFANVNFPERILSLSWVQLHLVLSIFAALIAIGFLLIDPLDSGIDKEFGLFLVVLASLGLVAGSVMEYMEGERAVAPGTAPPTPF